LAVEHIQIALDKARQKQGIFPFAPKVQESPVLPRQSPSWDQLPVASLDLRLLAKNRVVTASRSDPAYTTFDMLRTKVLKELQRNKWTSVAITSPTPGCGKTMVSLNLAFSFAHQEDCRSLLVDLDLRRAEMARWLGLKDRPPVEKFLRGLSREEDVFIRHGANLALAANGSITPFSAELLQKATTGHVLKKMKSRLEPNVVLYDLPSMLSKDDVMAFLPNVDCVILVTAAETSTISETDLCERELAQHTNVLGVVLNKCRYTQDKFGY
jgi:protein-tyrosine kinase